MDPDVVNAVRVKRSERIAVYAHRFGPDPAAAPAGAEAVLRLVAELRHRSHLVVVDGLHEPETRSASLASADRRVLVVEPTPGGATRGARLLEIFGEGPPLVVVRNHTRSCDAGASLPDPAPGRVADSTPGLRTLRARAAGALRSGLAEG